MYQHNPLDESARSSSRNRTDLGKPMSSKLCGHADTVLKMWRGIEHQNLWDIDMVWFWYVLLLATMVLFNLVRRRYWISKNLRKSSETSLQSKIRLQQCWLRDWAKGNGNKWGWDEWRKHAGTHTDRLQDRTWDHGPRFRLFDTSGAGRLSLRDVRRAVKETNLPIAENESLGCTVEPNNNWIQGGMCLRNVCDMIDLCQNKEVGTAEHFTNQWAMDGHGGFGVPVVVVVVVVNVVNFCWNGCPKWTEAREDDILLWSEWKWNCWRSGICSSILAGIWLGPARKITAVEVMVATDLLWSFSCHVCATFFLTQTPKRWDRWGSA